MTVSFLTIFLNSPARDGPLGTLPGTPGPHIEKIKKLSTGEWLDLGAPAADPKWGKARGRSWACRMPFAPELRGAFLTGEGVHGFVKPDGHVMDDLWFYDLNGHRWICCHPGSNVATLQLKVDAAGFETNERGEPVPLSMLAHAYENLTYDTDLRRLMIMPCPNHDYLNKDLKQRQQQWRKGHTVNESMASPWLFESDTGKWNRRAATMKSPHGGFGDTLIYLPGQKRAFFRHLEEVWFYDPAANTWSQEKPEGPALPFGIDATSCYDSTRERIYIGGGSYPVAPAGTNAFRIFDLKSSKWIDPQPKGAPCHGSNSYATNIAAMAYDSVNDVVIVFRYGGEKESERGIYVYDPAANAWSKAEAKFPEKWGQCANAFYDPVLNIHFFHTAGDSDDNGTMWAYRHRSPP